MIDDEPDIRSMLYDLLTEEGHEVVAADGRRGLAVQRERPADLIITDIFMPEKEGIEFPDGKIIAMSGGGDRGPDYAAGWPPASASSGSTTVNVEPLPTSLSTSIVPP
ncbi:MAG: response regulator [Candidatus Rokuibacteriota bacterium]